MHDAIVREIGGLVKGFRGIDVVLPVGPPYHVLFFFALYTVAKTCYHSLNNFSRA